MDSENQMTDREIQIGDKVSYPYGDGPALLASCGPAIVLAMDMDMDEEWPGDPPCFNLPSAWIRFTSPDGCYRYRSVDICNLEIVA